MARAGIQLIIYGQRNRDDVEGVLHDVHHAGFAGAETGNLFRQVGREDVVRRYFGENDLALCGCHAGFNEFLDSEKVREDLFYVTALDSRYLMCSGVGDRQRGLAAYRDASRLFNEVGKQCRDAGATFCYHNHAWEFEDREGDTSGMDVIAAETDPALVKFCIDVYWVHIGGEDPAAFVRKHADRGVYFHFKDGGKDEQGRPTFSELGQGGVDLKTALQAALETNPEWIVYEQDRTDRTPEESARMSRDYMREELGI